MRVITLQLALWVALVATSPLPDSSTLDTRSGSSHVIHERRDAQLGPWVKGQRVESHKLMPMRVGLKQQNLHLGGDLLAEIASPSSPKFGLHYTAEEVNSLFAPTDATVAAVLSWLAQGGIDARRVTHSDNRGWLAFDASAQEVERLLHAEYHVYGNTEFGHNALACDEYSVPENVQEHIDYITPGVKLAVSASGGRTRHSKRDTAPFIKVDKAPFKPKPNDTSTCDKAVTPACIRALYGIPVNTLNNSGNALGIFEEGDFYAQEDLDTFFSEFEPRIPNGTHPQPAFIDGATAPVPPGQADGESDLDFELAFPLIHPQKIKLYQTDDNQYTVSGGGGLFNTFLDAIDGSYCNYTAFGETGNDPALDDVYPDTVNPGGYKGKLQCGTQKPTNVISISYSKQEADLPYYYQQRQCNEFMKLALQGHTILIASGDYGVSGRDYDPEPNGCLGNNHKVFNPGFPSCPYVTTVGATQILPGKTVHDPESAAYDASHDGTSAAYSSGGGFSNIYSIPDYQKAALNTYFSKHDPGYKSYSALHNATHNDTTAIGAGGGIYNRIGRGMPDVAAIGQNIATYIDITWKYGGYGLSEGTSASTPIFASIVNNINEHRLAAGKKPIGFLNHILYSNPQVFNDITSGKNPGCGTKGFSAVQGWDPVTGLGTPVYPKMLELFMSLP